MNLRHLWFLVASACAAAETVRQPGTCALYGNCGKKSFFGSELPCPANIAAVEPSEELRASLVDICGPELFAAGPVCCDDSQVAALKSNLRKAEGIIASCPACKENFFHFFCQFTCSPDQSMFVDIVETGTSQSKKEIVTELDYYVEPAEASDFYDSCKEVKFGATNGFAMDLIGGGAKNYTQFLKFLGDEKPLLGGSPFQMNFPWDSEADGIVRDNTTMHLCNDPDDRYRCACADCPGSCPELAPIASGPSCSLWGVGCFSLSVLGLYIAGLLVASAFYFRIWYKRSKGVEALLLDDSLEVPQDPMSDDEIGIDEGYEDDFFQRPSMFVQGYAFDSLLAPYSLNSLLQDWFTRLGWFCATLPGLVIGSALLFVALLSVGLFYFQLELDPVNLWVSPESIEYAEKQFFDENFGPFYRSEQIYLVNETGPVLANYDTVEWWFGVEQRIHDIVVPATGYYPETTLERLCLNPLGTACVVQSFTQYFSGDINQLPDSNWQAKIRSCANSPVNCLPPFQQPIKKELVFGLGSSDDVLESHAIVSTWVVNNLKSPFYLELATSWEKELEGVLLEVQEEAAERGLRVSFNTERSLEQELNKSSNTDAKIVILSYVFMLFYASLALGSGKRSKLSVRRGFRGQPRNTYETIGSFFVHSSKFSLGLFGVFVVLLSVSASVGLCSFLGIKATLIIAEVIPFLILAVGVDNIFLLSHELELVNISHPNLSLEDRVARALGHIGPSILLSTLCETAAFSLGAAVTMPAVRNFALYSAGAVVINSMLQLTLFVSALSLDALRVEQRRVDCLPWVVLAPHSGDSEDEDDDDSIVAARIQRLGAGGISASPGGFLDSNLDPAASKWTMTHFVERVYAPWLLGTTGDLVRARIAGPFRAKSGSKLGLGSGARPFVIAFFLGWLAVSVSLLPKLELGLDQRLAVPADSYLVPYFDDLYDYFNSGPPVYFVVQDVNMTERAGQQALCGRFTSCEEYSLMNILEQERKRPDTSYIIDPAASWIDDFFQWLNPDLDTCCRFRKGTNETQLCDGYASSRQCDICYIGEGKNWTPMMDGFPEGDEFLRFFDLWITAPSDPCPLGGKAPYSNAVAVATDDDGVRSIKASTFRSSHNPLRSQNDFIDAYASARRIAGEIEEQTGVPTFPYSSFYIFFAQYATIWTDTLKLVGSALAIVFVISAVLLGSIKTALVAVLVVAMIVCNVGGLMVAWGVSLNAVSLVNLVICVGIGIEFCIHVARAFTYTQRVDCVGTSSAAKRARSFSALCTVGSSVFGGIALTKLIGVVVLAFTQSKIFEVYYFRMWLALVLAAASHSLVLLPVLLSYVGGRGYLIDQGDLGIIGDLASRLYGSDGDVLDEE